jgi:hypothetical protein
MLAVYSNNNVQMNFRTIPRRRFTMTTHFPESPVSAQPSKLNEKLVWGVLLVGLGILFLAGRFFNLDSFILPIIAAVLIGAGIVTRHAGPMTPGGILAGISLGTFAMNLPMVQGDAEGGVFLLSFALGWYSIVLLSALFTQETQWWAIVPAGIMGGIGAGVFAMNAYAWGDNAEGGVFLLSFALGWFSITALSALFTKETHWWAAIPGTIMAVIGGAVLAGGVALQTLEFVSDFWSLALIAGGAYLLWQRNR